MSYSHPFVKGSIPSGLSSPHLQIVLLLSPTCVQVAPCGPAPLAIAQRFFIIIINALTQLCKVNYVNLVYLFQSILLPKEKERKKEKKWRSICEGPIRPPSLLVMYRHNGSIFFLQHGYCPCYLKISWLNLGVGRGSRVFLHPPIQK